MRSLINVPFTTDLIDTALESACDCCKLVFPTQISAATARQRFMVHWEMEDCEFLTMQELRAALLLPDVPAVGDDKRLLCLYRSLTPEDKKHFHIQGYFDIVEWGQHFFQLFEELRDERVETEELRTTNVNSNINLLEWQEKYLTRVLDIHDRYRDLLKELNLTDPIFYHRASGIRVPFQGYKLVFVNQYYYSKLEKALIKALEDAGNEIVIITQSPGEKTGIKDLNAPGLGLENLTQADIRTTGIEVVECENEDQMVLAFLAEHAPANEPFSGNGVVLDRQFHNKHYKDLFDPAQFKIPPSGSIVRTGLHAFLKILHEHLTALNSSLDAGFIPLKMLVSACSQPNFLRYYQPGWGKTERDALLSEFRRLFEQDILYVDKELSLFQILDHRQPFALLSQILIPHFALLEKLSQVRRPAGLIDLIDIDEGLRIKEMCSEEELLYSDILEQFYERLANFASLEKLGIVDDWPGLFGERTQDLGANILWLFLEALSGARVSHKAPANADEGKFEISNLLDLRNHAEGRSIDFFLAGDPDPGNPAAVPESQLNQWVAEGLVKWLGHVDDMPALFRSVDVVALPSYREGLPRGLIEAGACGRPLITTDAPGCREVVVDGYNGLLIPLRDPGALASAIAQLHDDPKKRAGISHFLCLYLH
ncbi:MAG: glycosyltransferase [Candidatus Syntrophosphaera sp.]